VSQVDGKMRLMRRDLSDRLPALRNLLACTVRCTAAIEEEHQGRPADGSPASLDDSGITPVSDAWGSNPFATAQSVAGCYTLACDDHLQAFHDLLEPPLPALADLTAARGVLDAAARAWWLHDPQVSPLDRLARGWTERLHARWERNKLLRDLDGEPDDGDTVEQQARRAADDDGLRSGEHRGCLWVGQQRPATTELLSQMPFHAGLPAWRWMSGAAHGLSVHVMLRSEPVADDRSSTGMRLAEKPRPLKEVYTVAALALQAHGEAFEQRIAYYGWGNTIWRQWRRHVSEALKPAFDDPSSGSSDSEERGSA
jgi:hypothetical protein